MKKDKGLAGKKKPWIHLPRRSLMGENSNDGKNRAGTTDEVNLSAQNTVNPGEERRLHIEEPISHQGPISRQGPISHQGPISRQGPISHQELAELLGVAPDADTAEDGSSCSPKQRDVRLMERHVTQSFPEPPADVDQELHRHLFNVQETVRQELVRLGPRVQLMGLIELYHRQMFDHLDGLLKNINSSKSSFILMDWVLNTYLSQDFLTHPDLQEIDPVKKVDLLLYTEWVEKGTVKLLKNVQKEVRGYLKEILQTEKDDELYVDTLQCIDAMHKRAQQISPRLSERMREVCFRELLLFLRSYSAQQTQLLRKKVDTQETTHFFKTLNNCKHLKQYVQEEAEDVKKYFFKETMKDAETTLENMEAFTLKLLMKIVADVAEKHLKEYFKSDNKEFSLLIDEVKLHFSELSCYQDIQTRVMDEAYKLIAHIYYKRLIQSSHRKLRSHWKSNIEETVAGDAELLHETISDLAPGVGQWNLMLLKVVELLECESTETMKMTVGSMQQECYGWSEDLELLPALLRWKGLSVWKVTEVLGVLEDLPGYQPRPTYRSWHCCLSLGSFLKSKDRDEDEEETMCNRRFCVSV